MKKAKILLSIIAVTAMLFTVAFAAESPVNFGAKTVAYTEGQDLVISVYSGIDGVIDQYGYVTFVYDADVWTYVDEGDERVSVYDGGSMDLSVNNDDDQTVAVGDKLFELKFTKNDGADAIGSIFAFGEDDGEFYVSGESTTYSGSIEVVAAAAPEPEKPVSVSTTMTVNEKEYTDVPNAVVSGTIENGAFNGSIVVDYWKNGVKALAPKVFSTFAGMPTFSGSGSATFKVAIMGVPSNVTITSITVQ